MRARTMGILKKFNRYMEGRGYQVKTLIQSSKSSKETEEIIEDVIRRYGNVRHSDLEPMLKLTRKDHNRKEVSSLAHKLFEYWHTPRENNQLRNKILETEHDLRKFPVIENGKIILPVQNSNLSEYHRVANDEYSLDRFLNGSQMPQARSSILQTVKYSDGSLDYRVIVDKIKSR